MTLNNIKKSLIAALMIILSMASLSHGAISAFEHQAITRDDTEMFWQRVEAMRMRLVFIFDANQAASQEFAPIVADFSNEHRIYLDAYSRNGKSLPEITASETIHQHVIDLYFTGISMAYPLLVLVNSHAQWTILSQGITDIETLTTRLKAFQQKNRIKNIDDHMDRIYWEDQVEQAMKQTTRNLEQ